MARPALPRDESGKVIRPRADPFQQTRELLERKSPELTEKAIGEALGGNTAILNRLLTFSFPTHRPAEPPVSWPGVSEKNTLEKNTSAILRHALAGKATSAQALDAISLLNAQLELRRNGSMVEEISALFESHGLDIPERLRVMRDLNRRGA